MNEYLLIGFKTILFLLIILVIIRIMGKRELGELNVFDIIVSFMISELFSNAISDPNSSIFLAVLPILIIFLVQISISYLVLKSSKMRTIIESSPVIIINNGKIDYKEMKRQRYNTSDLLLQVRERGITDLNDIEFAVLEVNGSLNIFTKKDNKLKYPFPLISDGKIDLKVKNELKIDDNYIFNELKNNNFNNSDDVFLSFMGKDNHLIFFSKIDDNFYCKKDNK